jgi:hypothetical protein
MDASAFPQNCAGLILVKKQENRAEQQMIVYTAFIVM